MTVTAIVPGTTNTNCVDHRADFAGINHFGELRVIASTTPNQNYYAGIRFPTTPDLDNLRGVRLQLACFISRNDLNFGIRAHLHANSPAFSMSDTPKMRWDAASTSETLEIHIDDVPAQIVFEVPDPDKLLLEMVQQVIDMPGYVVGNPITLLLRASTNLTFDARLYSGINADLGPRMLLKHGPLASDMVGWQQTDIGDSMAAMLSHDGFEIAALPIVFMGSTTVGKAAAGMKNVDNLNLYGGGDRFRGYETPATVERMYVQDFGEPNFDITRKQHAISESTLGQWWSDISDPSGGRWGDPDSSLSLRYSLSHPEHDWQLIWLSLCGNDFHKYGGQHRLLSEEDDGTYADEDWQSLIDDILEPQLRDVIEHALFWAEGTNTWMVLPGYPNFCVIKSLNTNPQILPASGNRLSNTQDTFRAVYSLNMSIGGCQFLYDSVGYSELGELHVPTTDLSLQSALVRAGAVWQNANHPEEVPPGYAYNPLGPWWGYGLTQVGFPLPGGPAQFQTWNYGGISRWFESYRNVTDITVNRRFRMLDALYAKIAAEYDKVLFLPSPQSMGIDTTYSADPTSLLAQSNPLDWVEGIHPNKDGMIKWLTNVNRDGTPSTLERLKWWLPWMQKFSERIYSARDEDSTEIVSNAGAYDGDDFIPTYIDWPATLAAA